MPSRVSKIASKLPKSPKTSQKMIKKRSEFQFIFGIDFGTIWNRFGSPTVSILKRFGIVLEVQLAKIVSRPPKMLSRDPKVALRYRKMSFGWLRFITPKIAQDSSRCYSSSRFRLPLDLLSLLSPLPSNIASSLPKMLFQALC